VARCIDDEQPGKLVFGEVIGFEYCRLLLDGLHWKVGSTDLLCDTTGFTFLNVGLTDLGVQIGRQLRCFSETQ